MKHRERGHVTGALVAREEVITYLNDKETSLNPLGFHIRKDLLQLLSLGPSLKGKTIQHTNRRKHLTTTEAWPNLYSEDPTTGKIKDQKAK